MTIFTDEELMEFERASSEEYWIIMETLLEELNEKFIKRRDGK